jgi:cyclin-dependent kinase 12/13
MFVAREISDPPNYTNRIITLWYRPPEVLLGASEYGPAIDIWSVGCIFAELLMKRAIFPGKNEVEQLDFVFQICGSPTEEIWPNWTKLPYYHLMHRTIKSYKRQLRDLFKTYASVTIIF